MLLLLTIVSFIVFSCKHSRLGMEMAKEELEAALKDKKTLMNVGEIKDQQHLISVIEPVLFKFYGKEQITDERPYEIYNINSHWVAMGTLPEGYAGGTFLIIVEEETGNVIRLAHGK